MPLYMDLHIVPGVQPKDVAEAHVEDVKLQDEYGCKFMTYWLDEGRGTIFCLIDAPDKETVHQVHERAHGLVPHEIIEVNDKVVEAFLGRIHDPDILAELTNPKLKIFSDPAFRTILVTEAMDARLLRHTLGKKKADELLTLHNSIIRDQLRIHDGREVESQHEGFVTSFVSSTQAVHCALAIQKTLHVAAELLNFRMGIHAGEPVNQSDLLFGSTVKMAQHLCRIGASNQIIMSSVIKKLCKNDKSNLTISDDQVRSLSPTDESFLEQVMNTLADCWQDAQFGMAEFCRKMSTSRPQLYRKSMAVTGLSPNSLLREYRLLQSLELLKKEGHNISQTTFDTGFSSPSYFTKCFQKRFGMQPITYLKSLA